MPIYEFYCPENHTVYSFFARSLACAGKTPRCPDNPAFRMERLLSRFSVPRRTSARKPEAPGAGPEDARMEAALAQMEREFAGMDESNPDPRMLARMMRRMSDLTGEGLPGQMEEVVRRMEAGEDPEKLEAEFGDLMDESMPDEAADPEDAGAAPGTRKLREQLRRLRDQPRRDPTLYEMREFVD